MDRECPNQSSASVQLEPEDTELQLQVDFFRKLGYSSVEVKAALKKLGVGTDTNSVLGELVGSRSNCETSVPNPDSDDKIYHDVTPPPQFYAEDRKDAEDELKPIIIDGSNVAMSHGNKEVFSCRGIQLAVNFFLDRGHTSITVFVPSWRKELPRPDAPISDQHILTKLEKWKIVVFTPSRRVGGKRVVCYDDRFIVKLAHESGGVIVSNDTYRDLQGERPEWKRCIEERLLMYSFVNDKFMPPDDPLGRHGPSLDNFLRKNPLPAEQRKQFCPYDKKCTYGIKCKFYHPERANHSYRALADELRENARVEERGAAVSPGRQQWASGLLAPPSSSSSSLESDVERRLSLDDRGAPPRPGAAGYWDVAGQGRGRPGRGAQPFPGAAHDRLDSGLGSYESQCSDASHGHSQGPWLRHHQHHQHTPGLPPSPPLPSCCCGGGLCPQAAAHRKRCAHQPSPEARAQPGYDGYPAHAAPPAAHHHQQQQQHHYSLPTSARPQQQNYWSEPFRHLPPSPSPPAPPQPPQQPPPGCSYRESRGQSHPWGQPWPPPTAFDPDRQELRKKLQAIFSPRQVDAVMAMFPHLMDAQKLAAEILNLKARGGVF